MKTGKRNVFVIMAIIIVIIIIGYGWFKGKYNNLVMMDESVNGAWAQVENQLQRRLDLIPNLVNTVKGYAGHEKEVLTAVTEARSRVGSAQTIPDKINANGELSSALGRLLVVMENYPNLKADQNFLNLQAQLEGTENRISVERRRYNTAVQSFNILIRKFPEIFIAKILNFERKEFFKSDEAARNVPEVKF